MSKANRFRYFVEHVSRHQVLAKNVSWTVLGNLTYALSQWAILITLARISSAKLVGQFSLGLAITAPIMMFLNMKLRILQVTDVKAEFSFGHFLGLRIITSTAGLGIICTLAMLVADTLDTVYVIVLVGGSKVVESLSDIFQGISHRYERMEPVAKSQMLRGIASVVAVVTGIAVFDSLVAGVALMSVAWAIILLAYDVPTARRMVEKEALNLNGDGFDGAVRIRALRPLLDNEKMRELAILALPLGLVATLESFSVNIPRYVLHAYTNEETLGYYAAVSYFVSAGNVVVLAYGNVLSPRLARFFNFNRAMFRRELIHAIAAVAVIGFLGVSFAIIAGDRFLQSIYGDDYYGYSDIFAWCMVAGAFGYVGAIVGYGLHAARRSRVQLRSLIISVAIIGVSSMLLVPRFGMSGAAWSWALGGLAQIIYSLNVLLHGALRWQ